MRTFTGLDSFARFLTTSAVQAVESQAVRGLADQVGREVAETAKAALGTYTFGWPALKPETIKRKKTGDSPLLETGAMRDSIGYTVEPIRDGYLITVGARDAKAVHHEFGTAKIPPRPFLAPAAARAAPDLPARYAQTVIGALTSA